MAEFTKGAMRAAREIQKAQQEYDHGCFPLKQSETAAIISRETKCGEMLEALEDALVMLYADECDVADLEETIGKVERVIREARGMEEDK